MKKKTEKLQRLVRKLSAKYGKEDVDVLHLHAELDALVELEESRKSDASDKVFASTGPSPAKLMYRESMRASRH